LVIAYGRRRVGKTRLLREFLSKTGGLYFYVPMGGRETVLTEVSQAVEKDFFKGFRFQDFGTFLEYLSKKLAEREVVVIDEFQRLVDYEGALSLIQKYWDERYSKGKGVLVLSGSSIGTIKRVALEGDAPLYGRRTFTMEVKPLGFRDLRECFRFDPEELVRIYGAFGGTPAYLEKVDDSMAAEENIVRSILRKGGALYDEPEYLLMEEVRAPGRYMDILTAISLGKNSLSEISDATGIRRENITTYLGSLESMKLISRESPVLAKSKRSQYVINDPFFEFWFRFVRPNKQALELGLEREVWANVRDDFNAYLGRVFQRIAREHMADRIRSGALIGADVLGGWWHGGEEIDLVAYSSRADEGILFEVKWKELSYGEAKSVLLRLAEKAGRIPMGRRRYGIVAKRVEERERLDREGYIVVDLEEILSAPF